MICLAHNLFLLVEAKLKAEGIENEAKLARKAKELAKDLIKIFQYGFTIKNDGQGFGLHACANAAKEMGGALKVQSDGIGCGAVFTLLLPTQKTGATGPNVPALRNSNSAMPVSPP